MQRWANTIATPEDLINVLNRLEHTGVQVKFVVLVQSANKTPFGLRDSARDFYNIIYTEEK